MLPEGVLKFRLQPGLDCKAQGFSRVGKKIRHQLEENFMLQAELLTEI